MSLYKRKNSLRLQGYDYSQAGAYFVTILAYKRLHLFGKIEEETMHCSKLGELVDSCWQQIPEHYAHVELDAHVIMPNHMHGIIVLHDDPHKVTLGHIINTFKGAVTRTARKIPLDIDLDYPVWHRNFHDHIIRNQRDYETIVQYVATNPARWEEDSLRTL